MKAIKFAAGLLLVMMTFAGVAAADKDFDREIKKHPGYVSFSALDIFESEAKVEVYLREPMLKLLSQFIPEEEDSEDLRNILSKLKLVRVEIFETSREMVEQFASVSAETAKDLDKRGWERIVRVREDNDEHVDVYLLPSESYESIMGIVVMVADGGHEAVFVNIVGEIHPDDIAKLSEEFDIDELEGIKIDRRGRRRN